MSTDFIPYGRQSVDQDDLKAVAAATSAPLITQGPLVPQFEESLASASGASQAVVASSGTAALHLLYAAAGIGPGDEVIVPANTFAATAAAVVLCGARPVIADVEASSGNLGSTQLQSALKRATNAKLVVAVHFAGRPCDLDGLAAVCKEAGIHLAEDACHALGGRDQHGAPIGSHPDSLATVFSFHPVKPITSAEGGAIVTDDATLANQMRRLRHHAITPHGDVNQDQLSEDLGAWHYEIQELGFNYRLSDIHCALGLSQLKKLDEFRIARESLANRYDELLRQHCPGIEPLGEAPWRKARSAWHLYVILVRGSDQANRRRRLYDHMRSNGVGVQVHYPPLHHHPYYRTVSDARSQDLPGSEDYYSRCLSLPLFPDLSEAQQNKVIEILSRADQGQTDLA